MNLNVLMQFLAVVEHRSITRAAESLNLTQSALTKSIKRLEDDLGVKLLHRMARGTEPTRAGEILAERARMAKLEIEHGLAEIEAVSSGHRTHLRVGGTPMWATSLVPEALAPLAQRFPDAQFTIIMAMPETLMELLENHELDVIAVGMLLELPDEFVYERLVSIDQHVFARDDHPLRQYGTIPIAALLDFPWMVFDRDADAVERIMRLSRAYGATPPRIVAKSSSIAAMLGLAKRGDFLFAGPSILTGYTRPFGVSPLATERLWSMPAGIIHNRRGRGPLVRAFVNELRSLASSSGGTHAER